MLVALISTVVFAQFNSRKDVYDYLEGKAFVYMNHFVILFQNGEIILDWEDWPKWKCKVEVISFSTDEAYLEAPFKINSYMLGTIRYPMKISLDRGKEEFKLTGSPQDGIYKFATQPPQRDIPRPNFFDDKVYEIGEVDQNAVFDGGEKAMCQWIAENIIYPPLAQQNRENGRVVVSFIVDKNGHITCPKIKKSVSPSLDAEALRVVKKMPQWIPAVKNGRTVKMIRVVPITFSL